MVNGFSGFESEIVMKRICVFCGSSAGSRPEYSRAAVELGEERVRSDIALVYGGGRVGLMGKIAQTVLKNGGEVTGVIPKALAEREVAYTNLTDLRVVNSMHERKALMAELSEGFIALPGGLGTIEELFEVLTWGQLGIHNKPCGLLNIEGYFNKLIEFVDHSVREKFIAEEHRNMILTDTSAAGILRQFKEYQPTWIDKAEFALKQRTVN